MFLSVFLENLKDFGVTGTEVHLQFTIFSYAYANAYDKIEHIILAITNTTRMKSS